MCVTHLSGSYNELLGVTCLAKPLICLLCCLLAPFYSSAALAQGLTFCYEDQDSYPWVMTDGSGLNLQLLAQVADVLNLELQMVAAPWKRCLNGLEQGIYDGAFAASYKTERLPMGRYPQDVDGRLDERKRLHTSTYALYRRKGSAVSWNGEQFRQLNGRVGSLSGFSIVEMLRGHGLEVDETSRDPLALLQMLKRQRIEAAALQSQRADFILQAQPELAAHLEKVALPLEEKVYYLMLSNRLVAQKPELAALIWDEIERQRESALYQQYVQAILQRTYP
jgi:polar amino acid transport system substrate-binding protein